MPNVRRVVTQWLETESAFGVTDAPIPKPPAPLAPAPQTIPEETPQRSPRPDPTTHRVAAIPPPRTPVLQTPPPQNQNRPFVTPSPTNIGENTMARARKPAVEIPPTPSGNLSDLPPITPSEKEHALAALLARTQKELHPHLSSIATHIVFGEGDPNAPLMFIGEGPGIEEDRTGRPFVGRSGQLLDKQIQAMSFQRAQVYIANIVKLRSADHDPAENRIKDRPPTPEEVARQIHILHEQIAIIRPQAIVTLGAPAVKWLTGTTEGVMKLRGTWLDYRGIPLMPTYHPAFLLRAYTEENRKKVWDDLKKVMKLINKN